ncbi:error-prone DNA polymerase [Corynebacterium confusum]
MKFNGGWALSWSRLERILSGRPELTPVPVNHSVEQDLPRETKKSAVPFAELHAVSSYSFLQGASEPEELVERAVELGLESLALVDRDGFYGLMKFAEAAARAGLSTVFGAELSLDEGVLTVLARDPEGYRRLSRLIAQAKIAAGEKNKTAYPPLAQVARALGEEVVYLADVDWVDRLDQLVGAAGASNVVLEYASTMVPADADRHRRLDSARKNWGLRAIASARPAAARRGQARLAAAKNALAHRQSLQQADPDQHPMGASWLRSGEDMARLLPGREDLLAAAAELGRECSFSWGVLVPNLPHFDVPAGHTEMTWLRELVYARVLKRYASRPADIRERAKKQIEHELAVVEQLGFPGYFLIVTDLVDFCRRENILCQGRGSAANSAVCFALGITNAEPLSAGLLFERFLSPDRDGPPDIDVDIESGRREEVIQYVYSAYGRQQAAQVANVNTYRRKGATRDAARALGYPQGSADAWSKGTDEPPADVVALAEEFLGQPRHLGIHSGGMVLCDRPIADVVPMEWARMEGRSVLQWDKDDCAAAGLVKFDLLGLGMLEALHHMQDLVAESTGRQVNLWELDLAEEAVYDMLCRADAVGVFQVESRAQLATLPRLKPRVFFDLVVEVALIRPGPIQGGSVHPYLRRRDGLEEVTYDHPVLEKSLGKTLGIPLFQEQLMQIAVDAAGFTGAQADDLRRAMGSKRSPEKMAALKDQFFAGLAATHGIIGETADKLWNKIVAFAAYGFPESHSQSFASLVYFSAWFKHHYPAQFCVGLLRAQPMGFYSPQSLIQDARRHGVPVRPVSINSSGKESSVETIEPTPGQPDGLPGPVAIRLGLGLVKGLGDKAAERVEANAPYTDIPDLSRRAGLKVAQVEALAEAGALDCLGLSRRQALWQAGVAATERVGMLPGMSAISAPALPGMSSFELLAQDIAATGVSHDRQPMSAVRGALDAAGILRARDLAAVPDGTRVRLAGIITHRQRPQTAAGLIFLGMEDETGLMNVMVSPGLWKRQKVLARTAKALVIRGIVQNATGAVSVVADKLEPLNIGEYFSRGSRDFR